MANIKHLKKLNAGPSEWNSWRKEHPRIEPNLSDAGLEDAMLGDSDLSGANLENAFLSGADLSGADLSFANLENADLTLTKLCKTNLSRACLSSAKLYNADLELANLDNADLGYVDLTFACLRGANLTNANLSEATGDEADFSSANISYVDLSEASSNGSDFTGANLYHSDLKYAAIEGCNFSGADLSDTDLSGAVFSDSNLSTANLKNAILSDTDLTRANLTGANLTGAKFDGADFTDAQVGFTIFGNNDLGEVEGLETVKHHGPSTIGIDTIYQSQSGIPEDFLRGAGVSEDFITYLISQAEEPLIRHYSCFISHSSKNQQFAEKLFADLRSKGVRCWYAPEDLKVGEKIRVGIDKSIRKHDKLLLVLSKQSVKSDWVEKEVETALEFEKKQGRMILLPIRIDDAVMKIEIGWPGDIRRTRNIGDSRRWKTPGIYQKAFDRLIHDLQVKI